MDRSPNACPAVAADLKSLYQELEEVCAKMPRSDQPADARQPELQGPSLLIRGK